MAFSLSRFLFGDTTPPKEEKKKQNPVDLELRIAERKQQLDRFYQLSQESKMTRPMPGDIVVVDKRATKRAQRLVHTLNEMDRKGQKDSGRYAALEDELARLVSGERGGKKPVGAQISVPRV